MLSVIQIYTLLLSSGQQLGKWVVKSIAPRDAIREVAYEDIYVCDSLKRENKLQSLHESEYIGWDKIVEGDRIIAILTAGAVYK